MGILVERGLENYSLFLFIVLNFIYKGNPGVLQEGGIIELGMV